MGKRKILFILLFQCFFIAVKAQLYIGGGASYNFLDIEKESKYVSYIKFIDTNFQVMHPAIHVNMEYFFSKKISFVVTGQYAQAKTEVVTTFKGGINLLKFPYYNYSALLNYSLSPNFNIGTGINYFNTVKGESYYLDKLFAKFQFKHKHLGICFSVGYRYKNIYTKLQYAKSLKAFEKEEKNVFRYFQPIDVISFRLGYQFKLLQFHHREKTKVDCPKF
jgi:predicted porin